MNGYNLKPRGIYLGDSDTLIMTWDSLPIAKFEVFRFDKRLFYIIDHEHIYIYRMMCKIDNRRLKYRNLTCLKVIRINNRLPLLDSGIFICRDLKIRDIISGNFIGKIQAPIDNTNKFKYSTLTENLFIMYNSTIVYLMDRCGNLIQECNINEYEFQNFDMVDINDNSFAINCHTETTYKHIKFTMHNDKLSWSIAAGNIIETELREFDIYSFRYIYIKSLNCLLYPSDEEIQLYKNEVNKLLPSVLVNIIFDCLFPMGYYYKNLVSTNVIS